MRSSFYNFYVGEWFPFELTGFKKFKGPCRRLGKDPLQLINGFFAINVLGKSESAKF